MPTGAESETDRLRSVFAERIADHERVTDDLHDAHTTLDRTRVAMQRHRLPLAGDEGFLTRLTEYHDTLPLPAEYFSTVQTLWALGQESPPPLSRILEAVGRLQERVSRAVMDRNELLVAGATAHALAPHHQRVAEGLRRETAEP
ncbi:hypothetical protein Tdes44962_MAKER09567 [Teratosphaeria destructans]|uniref:Uncharacterized protein n=1 Tax=Teratosphaeria destructans TaxID=418781 RepID=A0A9W7W2Y4_9PEZI|nr:hypothetical protein Tdes44962_MAKER09567 [Teratosphaeria destructans]